MVRGRRSTLIETTNPREFDGAQVTLQSVDHPARDLSGMPELALAIADRPRELHLERLRSRRPIEEQISWLARLRARRSVRRSCSRLYASMNVSRISSASLPLGSAMLKERYYGGALLASGLRARLPPPWDLLHANAKVRCAKPARDRGRACSPGNELSPRSRPGRAPSRRGAGGR